MAVERDAEPPADEPDRVRLREVVEEVHRPALEERVEELVREALGRPAHRLDALRRECGGDELADPRVVGRLEPEETPALDLPEGLPERIERCRAELLFCADVPEVAAETAVAQAGTHFRVPSPEPALEPFV